MLSKLAIHYWRPNFTPDQAKQLIFDFIDDLGRYDLADVQRAIVAYRRSPERFWPTPGALIALIEKGAGVDLSAFRSREELEAQRRLRESEHG
jgi:hypothetical protein